MTDETTGIGMWAIVELFGHSVIAGYVTEEQIAGQPMLKVEVPAGTVYLPQSRGDAYSSACQIPSPSSAIPSSDALSAASAPSHGSSMGPGLW